ncbi:hypothetical protein B0H13DRAFT_1877164 [Mycena leptocephala]|nr:hypothetical protein B0H13DRAFT_1877164 [Mycena leptocephala]
MAFYPSYAGFGRDAGAGIMFKKSARRDIECSPTDTFGSSLTHTDENGGLLLCTYVDAGTCTYFPDGSFSSGSRICPGIVIISPTSTSNSDSTSAHFSSAVLTTETAKPQTFVANPSGIVNTLLKGRISSSSASDSTTSTDSSGAVLSTGTGGITIIMTQAPVQTPLSHAGSKSESTTRWILRKAQLPTSAIVGIVLVLIIWIVAAILVVIPKYKKFVNRRRRDIESQTKATPLTVFKSTFKSKRKPHIMPTSTPRSTEINPRQEYLHNQMRAVLSQLHALQGTVGEGNAGLTRQNEELRARINMLEEQLQSQWALGLSHEPPPGYLE